MSTKQSESYVHPSRERAVLERQNQSGVSVPIRQLEDEIAVIDAGLEKLRTAGPAA